MTGLAKLALPFPQIAAGLGALSLATCGLAAVQTWRMHAAHVEVGQLKDVVRDRDGRLKVSNASIDQLQAQLARKDAESRQRAAAYDDARSQNAADIAAADARARAADSRAAALKAIAAKPGTNPACQAPKALTDALEGL